MQNVGVGMLGEADRSAEVDEPLRPATDIRRGAGVEPLPFEQSPEDSALVAALRQGDEEAFAELIRRYESTMLCTARSYVSSRTVAEDVVSESWLAVIEGIDRFEGRASVKTWVFRILVNRAKTRGQREARNVPFSSLGAGARDGGGSSPCLWTGPDRSSPYEEVLSHEALALVGTAIGELPERQARVIGLRDVAGWSAREVCDSLGLADGNQRVLLHRARSKVRAALDGYFHAGTPA